MRKTNIRSFDWSYSKIRTRFFAFCFDLNNICFSMCSFAMPVCADRKAKRTVEYVMKCAFNKKNKELKGDYFSLGTSVYASPLLLNYS